jgi:hypothetical protein
LDDLRRAVGGQLGRDVFQSVFKVGRRLCMKVGSGPSIIGKALQKGIDRRVERVGDRR